MSFRGIQADLGGFDPRFLGITVRFAASDEYERFRAPEYAFSAAELAAMEDDEAFRQLAEMTVLQHELRHFHDFLLSPYGQLLFRAKLQSCFNGLQALGLLIEAARQTGANCLPVPVTRWARMTAAARAAQIEEWTRGPKQPPEGAWRAPSVPQLPDYIQAFERSGTLRSAGEEALSTALGATIRAYDKIAELLTNPQSADGPMTLQPWHIMEASALLVQAQEIANIRGEALANRFLNALEASGFPRPAVRLLRALERAWLDRELAPQPEDIAALVAWSLMGSYAHDGWKGCPTHRIGALSAHLRSKGPPPKGQSVRQRFRAWSAATGLSEPEETAQQQVASNAALAQEWRALCAAGAGAGKHAETVWRGAEALHRATTTMRDAFMLDPDRYVVPARYLNDLGSFPQPSVRCEFDGLRLQVKRLSPRFRKDWLVLFAQKDHLGKLFMRTGLLKARWSNKDVMSPAAASDLYIAILGIDYAFQPSNRLDWEFGEVGRPMFQEAIGLTPLEIVG